MNVNVVKAVCAICGREAYTLVRCKRCDKMVCDRCYEAGCCVECMEELRGYDY